MKTAQEIIRFSKTMSYALRHHPEEFGLELDADGSVAVSELLRGLSEKKGQIYTEEDLNAAIEMPGKKRFIVEGSRIRAYYGHSIKKEVIRPEIEPPEFLYHATSRKALSAILEQGLSPMTRQHVHLASTKETALDAGRRRDPFPPLLIIRAHDAWRDGIRFFLGNEDIFLSDPIPPKYITVCLQHDNSDKET